MNPGRRRKRIAKDSAQVCSIPCMLEQAPPIAHIPLTPPSLSWRRPDSALRRRLFLESVSSWSRAMTDQPQRRGGTRRAGA